MTTELYLVDLVLVRTRRRSIAVEVDPGGLAVRPGETVVFSALIDPKRLRELAPDDPGDDPVRLKGAAEAEVTRHTWVYRYWKAGSAWLAGRRGPGLVVDAREVREVSPPPRG